ncbi:vWA domain-containing protein [Methanorbis rubei]|uniref:VWFA domain-containing protein n=1 Tax=Methanorbis rubei TaxID=3028300 RepID=A0AAE4SC49_9EURY|nr:hypothetical protein [Methanocorpusculaceae archaeon Cs1]
MSSVLTLLVDCAGKFEGGRVAPANASVKKFIANLPKDLRIRIIRYSDSVMWHLGPEPVPVGEIEWMDLPSGGYLSSLAHAINLSGPTLSASQDHEVALLISNGAMSDPEEIVQTILSKRFSEKIIRAAAALTPEADAASLKIFAGDHVFDSGIFSDPRPFLSLIGEAAGAAASAAAKSSLTLTCSIDLGEGSVVSLSVAGTDISLMKKEMRTALLEFGSDDAALQKKIAEYMQRVL